MNENPIFSENADYVFMAQQAKERHSIESQIHMAMSHGSIETNQHGQIVVPSEDAFNIFQRLPGSPAYWKSFRNDLCAKMSSCQNVLGAETFGPKCPLPKFFGPKPDEAL